MNKTFEEWLKILEETNCHLCGQKVDYESVCKKCENYYCEDCSVPFTIHTQIDFNCCENCINYEEY